MKSDLDPTVSLISFKLAVNTRTSIVRKFAFTDSRLVQERLRPKGLPVSPQDSNCRSGRPGAWSSSLPPVRPPPWERDRATVPLRAPAAPGPSPGCIPPGAPPRSSGACPPRPGSSFCTSHVELAPVSEPPPWKVKIVPTITTLSERRLCGCDRQHSTGSW